MYNFTRPEYNLKAPTEKLILPESVLKSPTANLTLPESKLKLPGQRSSGSYSNYVSTPESEPVEETNTQQVSTKDTSYYSDPDDPTQINSLLDVLSKAFDPLENGGKIFSLATLWSSSKELFNRTIIDPIKNKDAKAFIMNNLVNLGETVDVLANIVKAALPTKITTGNQYSELKNSTAGQRMKYALGIGVQGRYSYDMDFEFGNSWLANIGEFAANLVGEFIVDPINWLTFGLGAVAETGAKVTVKEVLSESGETLIKSLDTTKLAKQTAKAFLKNNPDEFAEAFVKFAKKNLSKELAEELLTDDAAIKTLGRAIFNQAEEVATHKLTLNVLRTLDKTSEVAETFDKYLTRIAGMPVFTPTVHLVKYGRKNGTKLVEYVENVILRASKDHMVESAGSKYGFNVMSVSQVMENSKKAAGQLNLTKELPDDLIQSLDKASAEAISNSLSAQVLRLSDIITEAHDSDDLLTLLQKTISDFTQGQCSTVSDYLKAFSDALAKNPLLKTNIGDEFVHNLNIVADIEKTIIEKTEKAALLTRYDKEVLEVFNRSSDNLEKVDVLLDFSKHRYDTDVVAGTMIDYMGGVFNDASEATQNAINIAKELGTDQVLDHIATAEKAIIDFQNEYSMLTDALQNMDRDFILEIGIDEFDEFASYAAAKTNLMESIQSLADDINDAVNALKSAKQIKEVMDFKVAYTKRCDIISDIINNYTKGGVLAKMPDTIPSGTTYKQLGIDVAATKTTIKNMLLEMSDIEDFIRYLDEEDSFEIFQNVEEALSVTGKSGLTVGTNQISQLESQIDYLINFNLKNATDDNIVAYYSGVQDIIDKLDDYAYSLQSYKMDNRVFSPDRFDANVINKAAHEAVLDDEWAVLNTRINKVREITRTLEDTIKTKNMIFNDGKAWVAIRTEQFMNSVEMITGQLPSKLYNLFDTSTEVGKRMQHFRAGLADTDELSMLFDALENQAIYMKYQRSFMEYAATMLQDEAKWWTFNETLQNYGQINPNLLFDDATKFSFISRMQLNFDSSYMLRSSSLDAYRKRLSQADYKQFLIDNFGEENYYRMVNFGHTDPGSDVLMTKYAWLHDCPTQVNELNTWLELNPGKKAAFFDIETAEQLDLSKGAVNKYTGQTTQIALMDYSTNEPIVIRLAEIKDYYVASPSVKNIIYIEGGEQELYNYLDNYLKSNNVERLLGMNSNTFDVPFIKKRWSMNDTSYYSSKFNSIITGSSDGHIDIYKALRDVQGIPSLSYNDVNTIYDLLQKYATDTINMGYTTKVQSINPHNLVQNLDKIKRYIDLNGQSMGLYNDTLIVPYLEEMYKLTDGYYGNISNKSWSTVFVRDIWKEKANVDTLTELADRIHKSPEYIQHLMIKDSILTEDELSILLKGDETVPGFDIIQAKASDWWRMRTLYYEMATPEETFDMFKKRILNGREELTNLRQVFTGIGERSYYNYKNVINDSYTQFFKIDPNVGVHKKIVKRIMNKSNEMKSLINSRIKDEEAIFHIIYSDNIKLFENFADLKKEVMDLVEYAKATDGAASWISYIDLDQFTTPKEYFALWYVIANETKYVNAGGVITSSKSLNTLGSASAQIKSKIFKRINDNVFVDFSLKDVHARAASASPIIDLIQDEAWKTYSASQRIARLCEAIDTIPGAGAREYTVRQLSDKLGRLAKRVDAMDDFDKRAYINAFKELESKRITADSFDYLTKSLDIDNGIDYIISDLMFNDPIKKISLPADDMIRFPNVEQQRHIQLAKALLDRQEELINAGIGIVYEDSTIYLYLNKSKAYNVDFEKGIGNFNGKSYSAPVEDLIKLPYSPNIPKEDIDDLNELLTYSAGRSTYRGKGHVLTGEAYENMFNGLPKSVQDNAISVQTIKSSKFFSELRFDTSEIGPSSLRRGIAFNDPFNGYLDGYMYTLNSRSAQDLYMDLYFNPTNGMTLDTNGIFKGLSDKEIVEVLSKDDTFIAAYIVPDNSIQGYHVRRIHIDSELQLQIARQNNASLIPYQVYSDSFDEINNNVRAFYKAPKGVDASGWSDKEVDAYIKKKPLYYLREIMYTYKLGYLTDPGTWGRNIIDSNFKAMIDTKDPIGILRNNKKAAKLLKDYDEVSRIMIQWDPDMHMNTSGIKKFYKALKDGKVNTSKTLPLTQDEYMFIRSFIKNGPSAGESKIITDWIKKKSGNTTQSMLSNIGNTLMTPMNKIEATARFAEYLTLLDNGATKTKAFEQVSKTAFDYSIKTNVDKMIEFIIPFYNFQKLNLNYWLNAISNNTGLVRLLDDIVGVSWNTFNVTDEDYSTNQSLQYHMLNGNIQLSDSGLVLKLNPSYLDVLNLLMNPKEEILSSTFAPLQNFINYTFDELDDIELQNQLLEGTYEIDFGKLNGKTVSDLITEDNIVYAQWLLTQDWVKTYKKPVYDYLMAHGVYNDPKMPIGKYKGISMSEVPTNYKAYMLSQDWFVNNYSYIVDIWATGRNTVIPEDQLDNEPLLTPAEAEGLIASGIFTQGKDALNHLMSIGAKTLKDYSTYPIIGTLAQRYLNDDSTSQNNYQRLSEKQKPVQAIIASILPGVFGAVKTYEEFKQDYKYYSTIPYTTNNSKSPYTKYLNPYAYYPIKKYYPPSRSRNYYYTRRNRYRDARYFKQAQFTKFNIKKMRFNVNQFGF